MKMKFYKPHAMLVLALALLLSLVNASGAAALKKRACFPPPAGMTGWWTGDGHTVDLVGGRNAILQGDAVTGEGLVDQAFLLDGDGDFVSVPHDPALNLGTSDFTIDLWVYFNDTEGEQVLIEKWVQGGSGPSTGWTLTKLEGNAIRLAMASGDGGEIDVDSDLLAIPVETWIHFAATRTAGEVKVFMNGKPIATGESPINLDSVSSVKFGHRGNPSDTLGSEDERGFFLNGRIDEVELFVGRGLPPGLIRAIYNAGSAGKCKDAFSPPPNLYLRVNYGHDWVESFYEAGHKVEITVTESDGVTVKATARVVTEPGFFDGIDPGFQTRPEDWKPAPPDIRPYDWVYAKVDNNIQSQVQLGDITGMIDLAADSIQGTIAAPWFADEVQVECHPWGHPSLLS